MLFAFWVLLSGFTQAQSLAPDFNSNYAIVSSDPNLPQAVGSMIAIESGSSEPDLFCSVTLIGPNRVLTNSHCIPKNLRVAGAACGPQIEVSFPQISGVSVQERIPCDKVEDIGMTNPEETGTSGKDWAVLVLRHAAQREFAKVARAELQLGQKLTVYPVYYSGFVPIGEIYKVECTDSELGYMNPETFYPSSSMFFAKNCAFRSHLGNSGTGVWDEQGQYVGLIEGMVSERFKDGQDAVEAGSPNVVGLKTICLPFFGEPAKICRLDENDEDFQEGAILYSSLIALDKSLKESGIQNTLPQSSVVRWEKASAANIESVFSTLYDYTYLTTDINYFLSQGVPEVAQSLKERAAAILGYVPVCVNGAAIKKSESVGDTMPLTIFNFRDSQIYPGDQGLYVNMESTLELSVSSVQRSLKITVSADESVPGSYLLEYTGGAGPYALTAQEKAYVEGPCEQEKAAKAAQCADGTCNLSAEEQVTASPRCQKIYKKLAFSYYLKNFSISLPGC